MLFFIAISVLAFALNGSCTRFFQLHFTDWKRYLPLCQSLFCLIASFGFLACSHPLTLPNTDTVVYGVLGGLLFFGASFFSARGMATGSMALSAIITNMSLILPLLYSVLWLNEPFTLFHLIGGALFVCTFILSASGGKQKSTGGGIWVLFVSLAFLSNGMNAVVTKYYVLNASLPQNNTFMAITYCTASIAFLAAFLQGRHRTPCPAKNKKYFTSLLLISALAAVGSFGGNLLLTYLANKVDGAILYPCVNGGLCLVRTVCSCLVFRERLTLKKAAAILLGFSAIIILNL